MKRFLFLFISSMCVVLLQAQNTYPLLLNSLYTSPKREVRAVWLTTIGGLDWPHNYAQTARSAAKQQKELCNLLDLYQQAGINTVLLQTRIRGTVIYPSEFEPWDGCLSGIPGKAPAYDALSFAIEECHRRGMELHAWIVTIPIGKVKQLGYRMLQKKYPQIVKKIGDEAFLNPENTYTANYLANLCKEITQKYDIDGIHLDYIRYPETWKVRISKTQARNNITQILQAISNKVKQLKPWVKISCATIGKYNDLPQYWSHGWNAYNTVCQDAQMWIKNGLVDQLYPMMYFKGNNFYPFAINWKEESNGKTIVPGLGIYFLDTNQQNWQLNTISQEMNVIRQYGMGHAFFRGKFLTDNTKGIYNFTAQQFNRYLALTPALTWIHNTPPTPPTNIRLEKKTATLSWYGAKDNSNAPYLLYNIYASKQTPVNTNDSRNLVAMRIKNNRLQVPTNNQMVYAVTAIDRYGNESKPIQTQTTTNKLTTYQHALLPCDGKRLQVPQIKQTLDAKVLTIETLQGCILTTRIYKEKYINIETLPEGIYILRTINRFNQSHRLGTFIVRKTHAQ